ncbi:MAG: efflux RND transporter periplasmic adaptor subunit [Planctomycetota bacterium]
MEAKSFTSKLLHGIGILCRVLIPCGILALGGYAYLVLSVEVGEEKKEDEKKNLIRTNVEELHITDFDIVIETNGIIQPVNEVAFSAEVSGRVTSISPQFEVGSFFSHGDLLIEIDDSDYRTALAIVEARKLGAEAALELAKQDYERLEQLLKSNNVSEAEVMQAAATRKQASATLETAIADVEQAERDLERTKIYAPFDGRLRAKSIGLGQSISAGTPLGIAFSVELAEVRLPVSGKELKFLDLPERENDPALVIRLRDGINEESEHEWSAKIVRTEGTLDANSLELFAIARIKDPFGLKSGKAPLRIGQPIKAEIPGDSLSNVIAIPRASVRQLDQIYLVNSEELTISSRTIDAVWSDENHVIVRDLSIADGNLLSTTSLVYAPEGAKVEIIPDIELAASESSQSDNATVTN